MSTNEAVSPKASRRDRLRRLIVRRVCSIARLRGGRGPLNQSVVRTSPGSRTSDCRSLLKLPGLDHRRQRRNAIIPTVAPTPTPTRPSGPRGQAAGGMAVHPVVWQVDEGGDGHKPVNDPTTSPSPMAIITTARIVRARGRGRIVLTYFFPTSSITAPTIVWQGPPWLNSSSTDGSRGGPVELDRIENLRRPAA